MAVTARIGNIKRSNIRQRPTIVPQALRLEPSPGNCGCRGEEIPGRLTVFMIPVGKWSDGALDSHDEK